MIVLSSMLTTSSPAGLLCRDSVLRPSAVGEKRSLQQSGQAACVSEATDRGRIVVCQVRLGRTGSGGRSAG